MLEMAGINTLYDNQFFRDDNCPFQWCKEVKVYKKQLFVYATLFRSLILKSYIRQCLLELINVFDCGDVPVKTNSVSFFKSSRLSNTLFYALYHRISIEKNDFIEAET